ncbi:hypothetical protein P8629_02555 [Hydrogenovibrio sp. 3SP14C1]|uniref:tetratricopeptide repeat protein n=1 Tax=Hydrogenovibrio sp. 3SP14C1 TaxID=3038774 RepID=UPI0024167F00|nr:tetratricopeptide repeat protein [Hydrogenovibrio sp. 3SP14C1]MDG4811877.1 hypothetical protein [Hydrogenovibrio sp. 3SP14C1]
MSVLLEALKKAAEEKHRKGLGNEDSLPEEYRVAPTRKEAIETSHDFEFNPRINNEKEAEKPSLNIDAESAPSNTHPKNKPLDLETALALEETPQSDASVLGRQSEQEEFLTSDTPSHIDQSVDNEWSLNKIPGYQDIENDSQKEPKSAENFMKTIQFKQEGGLNYAKIVLSMLMLIVLFLGFGYYGVSYFQDQSQKMAQELQQYQRVKEPIRKQDFDSVVDNKSIATDKNLTASNNNVAESDEVTNISTPKNTSSTVSSLPSKQALSREKNLAAVEKQKKVDLQSHSMPNKQLKIVSSTKVSDEMLGYEAYQKNDYRQAKIHYLDALQKNPKNLTALFGLGATSAKQGEVHAALNFYRQALNVSPYNKQAETAVAILEASLAQPGQSDKRLRFMINQTPSNAKLQAALGHQYAKRKDWVKAQKQYFKAYQLKPENADYALNLAISLDQMGQYSLAKKYYQQALVHFPETGNTTSISKIKKRLLTLQQYLEQGGDQ